MIKANELRIGNWVSFFNMVEPEKYVQVTARFFSSLAGGRSLSEMKPDEELSNYYRPIPLTPEILEKCGFVDSGNSVDANWHYKLISIPTNHINVTYELNLFTTDEDGKYGINLEEQYFGYCNHLHQLQNLYFALTNTELVIPHLT